MAAMVEAAGDTNIMEAMEVMVLDILELEVDTIEEGGELFINIYLLLEL